MLNLKSRGGPTLLRQIKALNLPANRRKAWHRKMGREVIKAARKNIKAQRTVDGQSFAPGKHGKRVLRRIARGKNLKVFAGAKGAKVTWPNSMVGKIARAQQEGHKEQYSGARMLREHGKPDYDAPASASQAKALIKEGFKLHKGMYKSGKNRGSSKSKRVSQAWIKENMTVGQAGLALSLLKDDQAKSSWTIDTPARPFFGLNKQEISFLGNKLLNDILNGAKRAR